MLPTFVIGLREGLEAALIVGIIAAFLRKQGRRDLLRWVLGGVALAIGLCVAGGIALQEYSQNLPQRQQEGLETVIGVLAVGMVTYMVVWMRRNSRNLKGQLEGMAADALGGRSGAGRAMVLMAFLAVIREGVETVVFLLAAFNEASSPRSAGLGVVLGIAVAVALGLRHLPRRRADQPLALLPRDRLRPRARRGGHRRQRPAHRARGRLARRRAGRHRRSELARRARAPSRPRCSPACSASRRTRSWRRSWAGCSTSSRSGST